MSKTETQNTLSLEFSEGNRLRVFCGILTGQVAGLIMAVIVMAVFTIFLGKGPLFPVQVIGSLLFGESALSGFHLGAFVAGLILHQAGPSLLWGSIFGLYAANKPIQTPMKSSMIGLGLGIISMVGPYLLIPFLMNTIQGVDFWNQEVPIFWDWAAHLVFGLSFGLYPLVYSKLSNGKNS